MIIEQLSGYLPGMSHWVDCALVGALSISGFYMYRANRAIRALKLAQEDTPVQIQALIENLETVRASVSMTLSEVRTAITDMAEAAGKADILKDDVTHLTERLQRHIIKAQETIDEVSQVSAAGDRIADRILEATGLAKDFLAPRIGSDCPENSVIPEEIEEDKIAEVGTTASVEPPTSVAEVPAPAMPTAPHDESRHFLAGARSPRMSYVTHSGRRRRA